MTPQAAGAFLFAAGALMALNVMGIAWIFETVMERMEGTEKCITQSGLAEEIARGQ